MRRGTISLLFISTTQSLKAVLDLHCLISLFLVSLSLYRLIMAAAAVDSIPSYNRVEAGSCQLQAVSYPQASEPTKSEDVNSVASEWVSSLTKALNDKDYNAIERLFLSEACWRDQLGLSWDYHTFTGPQKIVEFLKSAPHGSRIESVEVDNSNTTRQPSISAVDYNGNIKGVASFLTIKTDVGRGRGLVRLVKDSHDGEKWKAYTLFTAMHELKGHEETTKANRPHGVEHGGQPGRKNWAERRTATENFEGDKEPTVLIIGAGQGGLTSAARLQQLQVPTLIVDQNPRVGDNWRNRSGIFRITIVEMLAKTSVDITS